LGFRITLMARKELTKSKAMEYHKATKKRKGEILNLLCEDTGWSRDNARRQLKRALRSKHTGPEKKSRQGRAPKYSKRSRAVLANVWSLSGTTCGQYLVVQIATGLLDRLTDHGELRDGARNKGQLVKGTDPVLDELRSMSSATIDRYLKEARRSLEPLSKSTTKKSNYALRNEIPFGRSYTIADGPGFLSVDTVAHCGESLKGEHLWTLNSTDVVSGWSETVSIKNKARRWVVEAHDEILDAYPYKIRGANYDGGSEFINHEMFNYSILYDFTMSRSRPYHSNDNAHVEQRNADIVRRHAFRYRYEGERALGLLNQLWYWVNLKKNYLVPCKKCIGHTKSRSGRTRGIYDRPKTPYQRVLDSGILCKEKKSKLAKIFGGLNDAHITRKINGLQQGLLELISDKDTVEFINEKVNKALAA